MSIKKNTYSLIINLNSISPVSINRHDFRLWIGDVRYEDINTIIAKSKTALSCADDIGNYLKKAMGVNIRTEIKNPDLLTYELIIEVWDELSMLDKVKLLTNKITMSIFGSTFILRVEHDNKKDGGRIFLQVIYNAPCTKTNNIEEWHGRKWYLSEHMTDDEIIKTAYAAFEAAVKHEVMEGFKVDGIILFNPHLSYTELLAISHKEIRRN